MIRIECFIKLLRKNRLSKSSYFKNNKSLLERYVFEIREIK